MYIRFLWNHFSNCQPNEESLLCKAAIVLFSGDLSSTTSRILNDARSIATPNVWARNFWFQLMRFLDKIDYTFCCETNFPGESAVFVKRLLLVRVHPEGLRWQG